MKLTRHAYETRNEKTIDFIIGFVGWFVLNGVLTGLGVGANTLVTARGVAGGGSDTAQTAVGVLGLVLFFLPLLINIAAIVLFAFTRSWIALGALAAFGVSLVAVVCLALLFTATCFALRGGLSGGFNP